MKKFKTDEELFAGLKSGDGSALTQLYNKVVPGLKVFSMRITKDREMAHEITIVKLCVCLKRIGEFETYDGWLAFLFTAVRNRSLNYLRDRQRHGPGESACDPEDLDQMITPDITREIIATEVQDYVREAIARISGKGQTITQRTVIEGWTSEDLAKALKLSKSTIDRERNQGKIHIMDFFKKNWFKILF